ncbi:rho GTPase-activating protein 18-like [Boleophthalmus pectinirostris]|uniref:rho GTPase-activating protein 18-like n=1 Tax=Boleophthalmus pectinirostris TaxID=150288 RepID=UPI00242BA8A9|nr:rho GTPase-activating protein 18-like [Boleophthalmus pectinirostris]
MLPADSAPLTSDPRHTADSAPLTSDPRHVAMETYWREVQSIEEEEEEDEETKSLDELELEEAWLVQSGLSALTRDPDQDRDLDRDLDRNLDQDSEDPPELREAGPVEALLSTLTRRQTDTVRRRLDNYTHTLRQRNRPIRDVRHIFTQTDSDSDSSIPCESPKRFHTTTRTIRRHNGREP